MTKKKSSARKGKTIELENITDVPQRVYDTEGVAGPAGRMHEIPARQYRGVSEELAAIFLRERAGYVVEYMPTPMPHIPGEEQVWIANATGNPWLPTTVKAMRIHKGEEIEIEVPNPKATPKLVHRPMKQGQKVVATDDGADKQTVTAGPPLVFEVPPYRRRPFSVTYAEWFLRRDSMYDETRQGEVVQCRPPSEYEPNETWSLTELQCWAMMVAPQLFHATSLEPGAKHELFGEPHFEYESEYDEDQARERLWQALWFVVIDPVYNLVGERDFKIGLSRFEEQVEKKRQAQIVEKCKKTMEANRKKAAEKEAPAQEAAT